MNINCIYLRFRRQKGLIYKYCTIKRIKSSFNENICCSCELKAFKQYKSLKTSTSKQRKLENKRYSILTDNYSVCYECGVREKDDIHEIYPGSKKQISMKNGFCIPVCRKCHEEIQNNEKKMLSYKIQCQREYEKSHSREEFMNLIKKNYIYDGGLDGRN